MHVRIQVRKAFVDMLKTIPNYTDRVFPSRAYQIPHKDMPCFCVYGDPETVEKAVKSHNQPGVQKRFIRTQVFAITKADDNIEDAVDDLCELVEKKVFEDFTLGNLVAETTLIDTSSHISGEPGSLIGTAVMTFESIVFTKEGKPDISIRN